MDIPVLGTGVVGRSLAAAIAAAGHDVVVGIRDVGALRERRGEGAFALWAEQHPEVAVWPVADAAARGELVFNATAGAASLSVLEMADEQNLAHKILVDVANALDFSQGFPPSLTVANTDSLAEQIQRALPRTRVVKALNTVNASVMVDPAAVGGGDHDLPINIKVVR